MISGFHEVKQTQKFLRSKKYIQMLWVRWIYAGWDAGPWPVWEIEETHKKKFG